MPQISVIIPTYNRARYIAQAVDSVLRQSFSDCEIIVVDDGSADQTRQVLQRYGDRIRYLYQDNAGVSAARNTGIRAAAGTWIAFLDSDDEWRTDYLATQMRSVRRYPQAVAHLTNSVSICLDGSAMVDHFKEVGVLKRFGKRREILLEKPFRAVVTSSHWFLQPIMIRRDALLEAGLFDTSLTIAEDMDLVARVALRGPFALSREVLVDIYRREEETSSLSAQYMNRGIYSRNSFCKVFTALMALPELTLLDRVVLRSALASMWRALGNIYLGTGNIGQARHYYRKSLIAFPSPKGIVKYCAGFLPQGVALMVIRKRIRIVPGDDGEIP